MEGSQGRPGWMARKLRKNSVKKSEGQGRNVEAGGSGAERRRGERLKWDWKAWSLDKRI
jgi:hypothetical protein